MSTSTVTPEIAAFAQGVRAALSDLPSEEVEDLTEGLEADLTEAYAEDLQRELPDPAAYATELRSAAGLPIRTKPSRRGALSGLVDGWNETRRDLLIAIRRNPALAATLEFLTVLRPLWWVARAWLATWLLAAPFGMEGGYGLDGAWWVVLLAFIVISVQWGRGLWRARGVPAVIVVGNVVAVLALLPIVAAANDRGDTNGSFDDGYSAGADSVLGDPAVEGLSLNGKPLENVYAYDVNGKKLRGVQLFDIDGNPLVTNRGSVDSQAIPEPAVLETGVEAYNVYPLALTAMFWDENGDFVPDPTPDPAMAKALRDGPFLKVPAVDVDEKVAKSNR